MKAIKCLLLGSFLLLISGCQTINYSGNSITSEDLAEINEQHPTKEELVAMIGSPTYVPDYSSDTWYYIERTYSTHSILPRTLKNQQIIRVTFRENNLLKAELVDDIQANDVRVNPESTESYGSGAGSIEKFVDNIGKFRKPANKSKKKGKK